MAQFLWQRLNINNGIISQARNRVVERVYPLQIPPEEAVCEVVVFIQDAPQTDQKVGFLFFGENFWLTVGKRQIEFVDVRFTRFCF